MPNNFNQGCVFVYNFFRLFGIFYLYYFILIAGIIHKFLEKRFLKKTDDSYFNFYLNPSS